MEIEVDARISLVHFELYVAHFIWIVPNEHVQHTFIEIKMGGRKEITVEAQLVSLTSKWAVNFPIFRVETLAVHRERDNMCASEARKTLKLRESLKGEWERESDMEFSEKKH